MTTIDCVRCLAKTNSGLRCKRSTCIYSTYCFQHFSTKYDLKLKTSTIPNSGKGLFTLKEIPRNRNVAQYTGRLITEEQYEEEDSGYGASISNHRIVDANSTQDGIARYANDCRILNRNQKQCNGPNVEFVVNYDNGQEVPEIWLRSTKKILANSEIFLEYGDEYWEG